MDNFSSAGSKNGLSLQILPLPVSRPRCGCVIMDALHRSTQKLYSVVACDIHSEYADPVRELPDSKCDQGELSVLPSFSGPSRVDEKDEKGDEGFARDP